MRRFLIVLLLLAPVAVSAQIRHPPDTVVGSLPTCTSAREGRLMAVTDAADSTDCSTGAGTATALCQCKETSPATYAWEAVSGGGVYTTLDADYGDETITSTWTWEGLLNFDGTTEGTLRQPSSTTLPATCTIGDTYWDTDADTDGSLYVCRATNIWKEVDDDGGGTPLTVEEADLSPTVANVATIQFDQADGFTVTDETGGQVQVDIVPGVVIADSIDKDGDGTKEVDIVSLRVDMDPDDDGVAEFSVANARFYAQNTDGPQFVNAGNGVPVIAPDRSQGSAIASGIGASSDSRLSFYSYFSGGTAFHGEFWRSAVNDFHFSTKGEVEIQADLGGLAYLEIVDTDTNPTCAAGEYKLYSDTSETKWKKCENGTATDLDTGGGGSPGGSGTEIQYRAGASTFGAVTGSSTASGGVNLVSQAAGTSPLVLTGAAGQTADLLKVRDSTPTDLVTVSSAGILTIPNGGASSSLVFSGAGVGLRVTDTTNGVVVFANTKGNGQYQFQTNSAARALITGLYISTTGIGDASLLNEVTSASNPSVVPTRADDDTGMGQNAANDGRLIAGGSSALGFRQVSSQNIVDHYALVADAAQAATCTDSGDGNPGTLTLTPTRSYVELTNADVHGCTVTMGETGMVEGMRVEIVIVSNAGVTVDFADTAGVSELAGVFNADINDSLSLRYTGTTWVETTRSAN